MAVIFVAKGQGLMAVISPKKNADNNGIFDDSKNCCNTSIF
jgi:hypothetical protein